MREEQPFDPQHIDAVDRAMDDRRRTALCSARHSSEMPALTRFPCQEESGHAGDHRDGRGRTWPQTDSGWAAYIRHVSECPNCMGGINCRTAEQLHAEWKDAQRAVREERRS